MGAPRQSDRLARAAIACAALLFALACSPPPGQTRAAIAVTVELASDSPATCVRVLARREGVELVTEPIVRRGRDELKIGIWRGGELQGELTLLARAFVGKDCDAPQAVYEESEAARASFKDGEIVPVTLRLNGHVQGDSDNDGHRATAQGGDDCLDSDPAVHPSATERCDNAVDDDCQGGADCSDSACAGSACSDQEPCTQGERCSGAVCQGGQATICSQPPSTCHAPLGVCGPTGCVYPVLTGAACPQGVCRSDGACVPPTTEVQCGNGVDDDGDGKLDCADADCDNQSCSDGNACTTSDSCRGGACVPGGSSCSTPPGPCELAGSCLSDGGCSYPRLDAGAGCGSGLSCAADRSCVAIETGGASCSDGVDNDGDLAADCLDPSCEGSVCDDRSACTQMETCQASACTGTQVACNSPPTACHLPRPCEADAGCRYVLSVGASCGGGRCLADAGCDPYFDYPPSNFDPSALRSPDASVVIDCAAELISNDTHVWTGCLGSPVPAIFNLSQGAGNESAKLVVMDSLTITSTGTLLLRGQAPVILAVLGDVQIDGVVNAGSIGTSTRGSGGSRADYGVKTHCSSTGGAGANGTCTSGSVTCGGGGGGAFGSAGGAGGPTAQGAPSVQGGVVNGDADLTPLRGGCNGGRGGPGGVFGGAGGGAVQLSAAGTLVLSGSGRVRAHGGGGNGGFSTDGGAGGAGGGGSGGAILLEAQVIDFRNNAIVSANGGAGGEGDGNNTGAYNGASGQFGNDSLTGTPGANGATNRGGPGGNGAGRDAAATRGDAGSDVTGNGGGGGGGVGRIRINSPTACSIQTNVVFTPAPTSNRAACP